MKLSLLDQLHISPGESSASTLAQTIRLARHLEALGFARHWIVEHHAVPYELCADPMLMALGLAQATTTMRVGVGGVLLNNYSPYKVAESLKTLALLAPDRIDVGLGNSISGALPDLALQVDRNQKPAHDQGAKIEELLGHLYSDLPVDHQFAPLTILPDVAPTLPWIMAVSPNSGARAGRLGLPLALSAFHRPEEAVATAEAYRKAFRPSGREGLPEGPQSFLALRLFVAPTLAEAERLAMPMRWAFDQRRRLSLMPQALPTIEEAIERAGGLWPAPAEPWPMYVITALDQLRGRLFKMAEALGTHEIMLQDAIPHPQMRLEHYSQIAEEMAKG